MQDDVAIGSSVRGERGEIVDFVIQYASAEMVDGAGRSGGSMVGRRLSELYPGSTGNGLLQRFTAVVETGEPFTQGRMLYEEVLADGQVIHGYWSMNVARYGDGYVASTRNVTALVAEEEARIQHQLEAERSRLAVECLQRAALPAHIPVMDAAEIAARYRPASLRQSVGGDWYDIFEFGNGRLGLVIGDVAGHGPEAAAFMVQVRNVVRSFAFEYIHPAAVLEASNRMVGRLHETNLFATCCYAVVEPRSGRVSWASAGHLPPLLLAAESRYLANLVGPPLGVDPGVEYHSASDHLDPGDRLVLFTDGLVEVRDRPLQETLDDLLAPGLAVVDEPAEDTVDRLVARALDAVDDLAVVCVRLTEPGPDPDPVGAGPLHS